jgi:hypothetical protein
MQRSEDMGMDEAAITDFITKTFAGVHGMVASQESGAPEVAWGDSFFFYDPDRMPSNQRFPFATIVTKDYGDFDCASHLNRSGIFRLNIGVGKQTYEKLFGARPRHPETEDGDDPTRGYDFAALDRLLPHPVYGRQYWVCVLNPSAATFQSVVRPLLAEAYALAVGKYAKHADRE